MVTFIFDLFRDGRMFTALLLGVAIGAAAVGYVVYVQWRRAKK